jgi:hypothetical protein
MEDILIFFSGSMVIVAGAALDVGGLVVAVQFALVCRRAEMVLGPVVAGAVVIGYCRCGPPLS